MKQQQYVSEIQTLITGLPKYCASMSFPANGTSYTTTQVVTLLQTLLAAVDAKNQAKAAFKEAMVAEEALRTSDDLVITAVKALIALTFATSPTTLAGLGVTLRKKPAPLSTEAEAAKVAKARATRVARGTSSPKQKAAITGNVSGVTITPVVSGAAPSATTPAMPTVVANPSTQPAGPATPSLSKA